MKISYRWLRALVPELADSPERVAERLAMYGAPVEEMVRLDEGLTDVVIARVAAVRPHPNADRLSVCTVDAGGEPVEVVCGAPNVRVGGFYPFAPVGARLPGDVTIRKVKIRGEESRGMLCSERELGLGRDHTGIMELPDRWSPGESLVEALGLDDVQLEVEVTANRPDLLSHIGVARELAPDGRFELPPIPGYDDGATLAISRFCDSAVEGEAGGVRITIEDPTACTRYLGAVIRGVRVAPSPPWLASRLRAVGLRPINNVVDATNYVLYELGQPMHAFDLARLSGAAVRIRPARPGEEIVTLDGVRRPLAEGMLVIADAERPVAVAGVMGGEDSAVIGETVDVFLECAIFDPKSVRRTRRALGLSTDSSYRFERGVDPEGCRRAVARAIALIRAVAGGEVDGAVADLVPHPPTAPVVALRPERVSRLLGVELTDRQIIAYLEPLGFETLQREAGGEHQRLWFRVPGHRWYDVSREVDLVEEVARRHGYDQFPDHMRSFRPSAVPEDVAARLEDRLRDTMVMRGFYEARTAAFAPESEGDVALLNPLSSAESRLRRDLLPGLTSRLAYNFARGARNVRLFEIGTVFAPNPDPDSLPLEHTRIAAVFTGARVRPHWSSPDGAYDIWDLKGLLIEVAAELAGAEARVEPDEDAAAELDRASVAWVPGTSFVALDAAGGVIGRGGQIDGQAIDAPPWAGPIWGFELELRPEAWTPRQPRFEPLPAYPGIERDLALVVPDTVPAARVEMAIRKAAGSLLEEVYPFDLYRGAGIEPGARSVAFRLAFRAPDRTLTDDEVDPVVQRVLVALEEELNVKRRR